MTTTGQPHRCTSRRAVAIAVPLKDEAAHVGPMLDAFERAAAHYGGPVTVVVCANDCTDRSVEILEKYQPKNFALDWFAVSMLEGARHAGWARRMAFDAAAARLDCPDDLLLSTDADTQVSRDWIVATVAHCDRGYDAVAGQALTRREERAALGPVAARRLDRIGRYYTALAWLHAATRPEPSDPWPRHFYEGGASIALTLALYRRIGGAPAPAFAEDRALFDRIRKHGGRVRHPVDVRVFTSCRLHGRAPGGMADAVAVWTTQDEDAPLHELYSVEASLSGEPDRHDQLSFRSLGAAHAKAQNMISDLRTCSAPVPKIEPILLVPLAADVDNGVAERQAKFGDRCVATHRIVGLAEPMDKEDVAA